MLTLQIRVVTDAETVLNTAMDCLRFVTEFFEPISQSAHHIYHSALLLSPQSSIIRKLYSQEICPPAARVIIGIPDSWDSCTASAGATTELGYATWSSCGKFIAAGLRGGVEIRDSTTLERISVLKHSGSLESFIPHSISFSPGGHLLACSYAFHPM